jgi:AraC-like DNA-binding protein
MATDQITTMLTPAERRSVDAAGQGLYEALHRDSIDEVVRDVRERRAGAVVVSVARCSYDEAARVAELVREFPLVQAIALLSNTEPASHHAVLSLGRCGVRTLIDVRAPDGWRALRKALLDGSPVEVRAWALGRLAADLQDAPGPCWGFFETLFSVSVGVNTVDALAAVFRVTTPTLASRFYRLRLPTPRRYLAGARLTRAARMLENPDLSIASVSNSMQYSSPQAFGRHLQVVLQLTASRFRREYDGERTLDWFRHDLVLPYVEALRLLNPG